MKVLLEKWINLEGSEETGWYSTSGSGDKRATKLDNIQISRIRLSWTSGIMGNICEDKAKILVEKYVQRCCGVHRKLQEIPSLL